MITTILLGITLIVFAFYVYKFPPKSKPSSENSICMDYSNVNMNQLEVDLVRNMIRGYKDHQKHYIDAASNINDAHSIWFDLETLKAFIYHVEYQTKQNTNVVTKPELGLRIHYSRYPEFKTWKDHSDLNDLAQNPLGKQYGQRHTLVIIPTIKRKDGENVNFNPLDNTTYANGMPFDYPGTPSTTTVPSFGGLNAKGNDSSGATGSQNHGGLIPPAPAVNGF
jgi:hypothetical protein